VKKLEDKGYNPLVFFWVAFYSDETVLPQFDFKTGKENLFRNIDQKKLVKFGLFPFQKDFAEKVGKMVRFKSNLPFFILKLNDGQRLIYVRRNFIHQFSFQICAKCGYVWQWKPNNPEKVGEVGLPIHGSDEDYIVKKFRKQKYISCKCPKCNHYDVLICPDCEIPINKYKGEEGFFFQCPQCKKEYPRLISMKGSIKRKTIYLLGYQMTVKGKNKKHIMFISEDGSFEINENFNYR